MKFRTNSIFCIVLALIESAEGYFNWGLCPIMNPTPVMNFDIDWYVGNWYEIIRDKDVWYEDGLQCVTATYLKTLRPFY